jgi:transcription antitermination factor NusG
MVATSNAEWRRAHPTQAKRVHRSKKVISLASKPTLSGLIFVKALMCPKVADYIESLDTVRGLLKNDRGKVVPLSEEETTQLEELIRAQAQTDARVQREVVGGMDIYAEGVSAVGDGGSVNSREGAIATEAKKGEGEREELLYLGDYVSVVSGRHQGRYGIIEGMRDGRVKLRLRSEYLDVDDDVEVGDLRYLPNPPEVDHRVRRKYSVVFPLCLDSHRLSLVYHMFLFLLSLVDVHYVLCCVVMWRFPRR